jgi:hypothetical protein
MEFQNGKVILHGTRRLSSKMETIPAHICKGEVFNRVSLLKGTNIHEGQSLQIEGLDSSVYLLSFESSSVYLGGDANGEKVWIRTDGKIQKYETLEDQESHYIIGRFTINRPISLGEVQLDEYDFVAIFSMKV